jgi:ABC-type Co2+ transport system permease subunit
VGTTLACNVSRIGSLLEINAKVVNAFTGPLFGIFLLAMFSRRASSIAVLIAGTVGAFTAYYVAYTAALVSCGHRRSAGGRRWRRGPAVAADADGGRRSRERADVASGHESSP